MNFISPLFLFFIVIVLLGRWLIFPAFLTLVRSSFSHKTTSITDVRLTRARSLYTNQFLVFALLICSYLFYGSWNYNFVILLLFTSFYDFWLGKSISSAKSPNSRRFYLIISILLNLSILGFYKYFLFLTGNFIAFSNYLGLNLPAPKWSILLPAGISFYTFQSLSYTIDIYRGIIPAEKSFIRYALFLAFFPQLVAGPIVVAYDFLPQILKIARQRFSEINLNQASYFIFLGFMKKSVIADNISIISDFVFAAETDISSLSWWYIFMGMISYSIQIYGDFSGYTDIARGVAILLGFQLPENFNLPYFSSSLTDFWRRWHISLSSWLRSYLYIPLGGNRLGEFFTYRNLFITMLLGGLWHGASWNFIIWGSLHGIYLGVERFIKSKFREKSFFSDVRPFVIKLAKFVYALLIFNLVTCLWVFFRAPNLEKAVSILSAVFNLREGLFPSYSIEIQFYIIFLTVFISHYIGYFYRDKIKWLFETKGQIWQFPLYAALVIFAIIYSGELRPFIYFVF